MPGVPFMLDGAPLMIGGAPLLTGGASIPARTPSALGDWIVVSGHSLTDSFMSNPWPGRLILAAYAIAPSSQPYDRIANSSIPGSSLGWRWTNESDGVDAKRDIADYQLLITTEGVPLQPNPTFFAEGTLYYLNLWVNHAWTEGNGGNGAEVMIFSSWIYWQHSDDPPPYDTEWAIPFRERLDIDGGRWEMMQDTANANRPEGMPYIYMIPGHRLMMRIFDDIAASTAPFTSIGDLFADDIHVNDIGQYAMTCLVWACVFHRNPTELPNTLDPSDTLTAAQAAYLKAAAWSVARGYARAGVP